MTRLVLLVSLLSLGCTGSLQAGKDVALNHKYGGKLTEVPSAECQRLDSEHRIYGNVAGVTYIAGAGVAAGAAAVPEDTDHKVAIQRGMVISAAVLAGAAEAARQLSDARKSEWAEKCSIIGGGK